MSRTKLIGIDLCLFVKAPNLHLTQYLALSGSTVHVATGGGELEASIFAIVD